MENESSNKRVQGTLHKVSGPLTRNVGHKKYMKGRTYHHTIAGAVGIAIAIFAISCKNIQPGDTHQQDWDLIESSIGKIYEPYTPDAIWLANAVDTVVPRQVWPSQTIKLHDRQQREYLAIIERYPYANPSVSFVRIHLTTGRAFLSSYEYYCGKEDIFRGLHDFVVQQDDPEWGDLLVGRYFDEGKTNRIIFAIKESSIPDCPGDMIRLRREASDGTVLADDEFNKTLDTHPSK